jgi:dihydrofolate reductase
MNPTATVERGAKMRKVIYHVASTVDGFIGHEDHGVDGFIQDGEHTNDYLKALKNDYDLVFMGRNTYDFGVRLGVTNPYPWMKQYVFSSSLDQNPNEHVELVSGDPRELVQNLKDQAGKDLYLCGGGDLAARFLNAGLLDEIVLKLNPVLFGTGIPLFRQISKPVRLELKNTRVYSSGVILIRYAVGREANA